MTQDTITAAVRSSLNWHGSSRWRNEAGISLIPDHMVEETIRHRQAASEAHTLHERYGPRAALFVEAKISESVDRRDTEDALRWDRVRRELHRLRVMQHHPIGPD